MPKRGRRRSRRGDGAIEERDGRYVARISRTEGGIRRRESRTFTLRGDAEWWLSQAKRHGTAPEDIRLSDYLERWLRSKRNVRPSTVAQYANHVRVHIVPVLGGYRLVDLKRRHVESFIEDRLGHRSVGTGRSLSPATVGKLLVTLRSALDEAVPHDIPDNPAAKVEAPKVERESVKAMTPADAAAIVAAVRGTWVEHITIVLLGSGMRIGEAVALNQGDVHDGWVQLRASKTTIRAVRLTPSADEAIHAAIRQAPRRGKDEPVFFGPRKADRLSRHSVTHALSALTDGEVTAHTLRHGLATLMVAGGVHMRLVAEQLGHANPTMTARVYAHVAPDSQIAALDVVEKAIGHSLGQSKG